MSELADTGGTVHSVFTDAELPFPEVTLSNGEKVRLDAAAYTKYRASPNKADRDAVFKAFWDGYGKFTRTLAATLNSQVAAHVANKDVRKFPTSLDAAMFDFNIPRSVYTQLLADVHANLPTLHRYLKLRQKIMGLPATGLRRPLRARSCRKWSCSTRRSRPGPDARSVRAARHGLRRGAAQGLCRALGRFHADDRQELGRLQQHRLRRAPLPAAELQRRLGRRLDAGARVGPLDAFVPRFGEPALRDRRILDVRRRGGLDAEREPAVPSRARPYQGRSHAAVPARRAISTRCARRCSARPCSPSSS